MDTDVTLGRIRILLSQSKKREKNEMVTGGLPLPSRGGGGGGRRGGGGWGGGGGGGGSADQTAILPNLTI
jgi:hypothetical protein